MSAKKICIITKLHLSYNPRVLKEADALSESAYEVVVIAASNSVLRSHYDEGLLSSRKWKLITVEPEPFNKISCSSSDNNLNGT